MGMVSFIRWRKYLQDQRRQEQEQKNVQEEEKQPTRGRKPKKDGKNDGESS